MRATEFLTENVDQAAVAALQKKHGWSTGTTVNGDLYFTWQGLAYEFYGERVRINWPNGQSVSVVWGKKPDWQGRGNDEVSFAQAVQRKLLKFDLSIWQQLDRRQINDSQALQKFKIENERQARQAIAQGVTEGREEFNQEIMQPGFEFEQEMAGITYKVTNDSGVVMVTAWDSEGNSIGHAVFWKHQTRSGLESLSTEVNTKWHGKGIAANMYALVRMLGANINPSLFQTKQGKNMWKKWQQQGDVAHLKRMNAKVKDQDVAETINTDILNKRFRHKQVIGDYTYKASVEMFMGEPLLSIKAYDGDREIGHILFEIIVRSPGGKRKPSADYLESGGTEVAPEYRGQGVASTMYAYAKMLGNDIMPSWSQTSKGQAMWAAWDKSGDAKHLVGTSMESTVSENFDDGKVSGKSRPGRVKRAGASCSGSVTDLRQRAKNASGERAKMYHWCANMKSGRNKSK